MINQHGIDINAIHAHLKNRENVIAELSCSGAQALKQVRLFLSEAGHLCAFSPRSRTRGSYINAGDIRSFKLKVRPSREQKAKSITRKYKSYAEKAGDDREFGKNRTLSFASSCNQFIVFSMDERKWRKLFGANRENGKNRALRRFGRPYRPQTIPRGRLANALSPCCIVVIYDRGRSLLGKIKDVERAADGSSRGRQRRSDNLSARRLWPQRVQTHPHRAGERALHRSRLRVLQAPIRLR